jgi:hypothetical protein
VVNYLEEKYQFDLIDYTKSISVAEVRNRKLKFTDYDLGKVLNLIWGIPSDTMYYPEINFDSTYSKQKPKLLAIGDSFTQSFWGFFPFFQTIFDTNSSFWSCNIVSTWSTRDGYEMVKNLNFKEKVLGSDLILLVVTEMNYGNFGFGFIEDAYLHLTIEGKVEKN